MNRVSRGVLWSCVLGLLAIGLLVGQAPAWADSLILTWTDNANNEAGTAVERRVGTGSYFEITRVGVNIATYVDSQVLPSTTYTYRVRAFNTAGFSAYSNEASATVPGPPAAPSNLMGTVGP